MLVDAGALHAIELKSVATRRMLTYRGVDLSRVAGTNLEALTRLKAIILIQTVMRMRLARKRFAKEKEAQRLAALLRDRLKCVATRGGGTREGGGEVRGTGRQSIRGAKGEYIRVIQVVWY